ncbi:MAG TPA: hypothetical protein PK677_17120 [Acidiphilium sp.]|jgi:hypothetical protein|nr:hypothetical protein [Acidiphilium sp.]
MGRLGFSAAIAAIVVSAGCAYGQVPPKSGQVMSRQELEQLQKESDQRLKSQPLNLSHSGPIAPMPNPKVTPIKGIWVCKDIKFFDPIYAQPSTKSRVVARSSGWAAVGGAYVDGFGKVLVNKNLIGYVPVKNIKPFYDKLAPSVTCQVQGVQANGVVALYMK